MQAGISLLAFTSIASTSSDGQSVRLPYFTQGPAHAHGVGNALCTASEREFDRIGESSSNTILSLPSRLVCDSHHISRPFPPSSAIAPKPIPVTSYKCMPVPSRETTFDLFRRWGYLQASLDPLGQLLPPQPFPTSDPAPDENSPDVQEARRIYSSSIGAEFMHIPSAEKRDWIQQRLEAPAPPTTIAPARILTDLLRADLFEQVIQQRYLGTKRFSLEGLTVLIPFLDQLFTTAAELGVNRSIFTMSHRGRLNVMVNTIGRASRDIFTKFEDVDPRSTLGGGDVKYHIGAT